MHQRQLAIARRHARQTPSLEMYHIRPVMCLHGKLDSRALAKKIAKEGRKKHQEDCMKRCNIAEGGQITRRK